ncbi:hypothetical protein B0I75DRAFT_134495 [Yarrowia lipolytica]|nr:hypothetical protein BKA91DRAFT_134127 [Yarrowia lipolytica]RDW47922.1 hypothetical protein B0I74DRAFT_134394 [Yarrowia lipolytica]RDW54498.1 hypothetical protein B0I75DRAFT_134495 [Yarrowia lipolytica]RMJ01257.1 hypothetical protein BD777DRAFT_122079 [Yarrowia lipolytica]
MTTTMMMTTIGTPLEACLHEPLPWTLTSPSRCPRPRPLTTTSPPRRHLRNHSLTPTSSRRSCLRASRKRHSWTRPTRPPPSQWLQELPLPSLSPTPSETESRLSTTRLLRLPSQLRLPQSPESSRSARLRLTFPLFHPTRFILLSRQPGIMLGARSERQPMLLLTNPRPTRLPNNKRRHTETPRVMKRPKKRNQRLWPRLKHPECLCETEFDCCKNSRRLRQLELRRLLLLKRSERPEKSSRLRSLPQCNPRPREVLWRELPPASRCDL